MNQSAQSVQSLQSDTKGSLYVHAYNITRSLSSFQRFNVVAVDKRGEFLATVKVDLEFEDAVMMIEVLNGSASLNEARNGDTGDTE